MLLFFWLSSRVGHDHVVPRTVLAMLVELMLFSGLPPNCSTPVRSWLLRAHLTTDVVHVLRCCCLLHHWWLATARYPDVLQAALVVVSLSSCTSPIHCSMVCWWSAVVRTPHCRCCVDVVRCSCLSHQWWLTTASQRLCTRGWFPLYILPHKLFKTLTFLLCVITDFTAPFVPKCQVLRSHRRVGRFSSKEGRV